MGDRLDDAVRSADKPSTTRQIVLTEGKGNPPPLIGPGIHGDEGHADAARDQTRIRTRPSARHHQAPSRRRTRNAWQGVRDRNVGATVRLLPFSLTPASHRSLPESDATRRAAAGAPFFAARRSRSGLGAGRTRRLNSLELYICIVHGRANRKDREECAAVSAVAGTIRRATVLPAGSGGDASPDGCYLLWVRDILAAPRGAR